MNSTSPYLDFDFQKKIIADANELGINLKWMVKRGFGYERIINGKIEFVLQNLIRNQKIVYNLFKKVNNKKERIQFREKMRKLRTYEANKKPAIDFALSNRNNCGGGFGTHFSNMLTEMSAMSIQEMRERVENEVRGPCTPETSDDESE